MRLRRDGRGSAVAFPAGTRQPQPGFDKEPRKPGTGFSPAFLDSSFRINSNPMKESLRRREIQRKDAKARSIDNELHGLNTNFLQARQGWHIL